MSKRDPMWLRVLKLGFWIGGVLLFFRFLMYLVAFLGGDARDFWVLVAGASSVFLLYYTRLVNSLRLPDDVGDRQPVDSPDAGNANAIAIIKDETTMPDESETVSKTLHIHKSPIYNNNAPGSMINLGPVTLTQHFGPQQATSEAADAKPQNPEVDPARADDTIDIAGLLDYSATFRPQGVSRNTIDSILHKGDITPCTTAKEGRTIRNLYPSKESKAAIADYFDKKGKR